MWLTAAAMALGLGLGTLIAVMRLSSSPVLYGLATFFVWIFRGTPLLVQIIFWGYAAALYKYVMIGIPFTDVTFFRAETNSFSPPRSLPSSRSDSTRRPTPPRSCGRASSPSTPARPRPRTRSACAPR
ncbi:ABC transporter permease subunit [Streptomyces zhihengii]